MKSLKFAFLLIFTALAVLVKAQTADDIINKYIAAVGGKDKIENMKSIHMTGSMDMMGKEAPLSITVLDGKGYRSEVELDGKKMIQAFTTTGGWMINPLMGVTSPQPIPDEQFQMSKDQIYIAGQLFNYAAKGYKAELAGRENVNDVNAYKIVLSDNANNETSYYFDPNSYYMIKASKKLNMNGQDAEVSTIFSDYRKTDYGYLMPYTVETQLPQVFNFKATIKSVEINKDIDPKIFEMPKS